MRAQYPSNRDGAWRVVEASTTVDLMRQVSNPQGSQRIELAVGVASLIPRVRAVLTSLATRPRSPSARTRLLHRPTCVPEPAADEYADEQAERVCMRRAIQRVGAVGTQAGPECSRPGCGSPGMTKWRVPDWRTFADAALEATVVGSFTDLGLRARRAMGPWEDLDTISLTGRTVLVTGATSGLGLATAQRLARMGAKVAIVGRNVARLASARAEIQDRQADADIATYEADLADLAEVRRLADEVHAREARLDALVHNAGALLATRALSPQGHEVSYASMVLAPALLTEALLPLLERSADLRTDPPTPARVILVSSGGMYAQRLDVRDPESERSYRGSVAYAKAKRAQVVLAECWGARWRDRGLVVHAMHPGWAATPGVHASLPRFERVMGPVLRSPSEGADTIVWLVASSEPGRSTGRFWHDRRARSPYHLPGTRESAEDRARLEAIVAEAIAPFRESASR
jgi:dehydrogenase/reductase SDR family protein 12